jgi:hypothetical protein
VKGHVVVADYIPAAAFARQIHADASRNTLDGLERRSNIETARRWPWDGSILHSGGFTTPQPSSTHILFRDTAINSSSIWPDLADDFSAMRTELSQFDSTDQPMKYLRAGLIGEARRGVAALHRSSSAGEDFAALAKGDLAILDRRPTDGIEVLRRSLPAARRWRNSFPDYGSECESLGNALSRAGDDKGAIQTLETCTDQRPGFSMTSMAPFWMRARVRLADLYRKAERFDDAQRQEQEVRTLLSEADPDHPLLRHLEAIAAH